MGLDVLMHITCTGMTREYIIDALDRAKEAGIRNILALRGDPPHGQADWEPVENGFSNATQIVRFIKERYGDFFCIVVAGYPEIHLQATSREDDIQHLKEKCDAGSDIIITQLFYNNDLYLQWVKECREAGITAHIIPGIMPILGYDKFHKSVKYCQTNVPQDLYDALEPLKADDDKVREFGVQYAIKQSQDLIDRGEGCRFLHYYTMNLETSVIKTIQGLGILNKRKVLPFQLSTSADRQTEDVRPIFWANKPQSYLERTKNWDEFPNGRWGVSRSPAFDTDEGFVSYSKKFYDANVKEKTKCWGSKCTSYDDVIAVFVAYLQGKIKKFPFSEGSLAPETIDINDILLKLNRNKFFTINSQPKVNGVKSSDEKLGWGPNNGYVYQKAYFEFFVPAELIQPLVHFLDLHEEVTYQAINSKGARYQNVTDDDVNAVTWGVFRGKEIIQPTVVDHQAFVIWKDECFKGFSETWSAIYKPQRNKSGELEGGDKDSADFLKKCSEEMWLVNIVDNDYIGGDLTKIMDQFIEAN